MGNLQFEELLWNQASVEINNFYEDNGIFNADTFQRDFKKKCQSQIFLVLEHSIIVLKLRGIFKPLLIRTGYLGCMFHFIINTMELMTCSCNHSLLGLLFGVTIGCQIYRLV